MKNAVIFDFDGTLVDGQEFVLKGVHEVINSFLNKNYSLEEVREKFTPHVTELYDRWGIDLKRPDTFQEISRLWGEVALKYAPELKLFEGVSPLLEELYNLPDVDLYVLTARDYPSTIFTLKSLKVDHYFKKIRGGDTLPAKPDPRSIEGLIGEEKINEAIMIGDSSVDIQVAKSYGIKSIGAVWDTHVVQDFMAKQNPSFMASKPLDCLSIIKEHLLQSSTGLKE